MAESSIDFSRLRNPTIKDVVGDAFNTTTGHTHDGTDSALVSGLTATIDDGAVTTAKIANLAVTEGKINTGAVTAGKIGSDAVTTVKILDANVTTGKLADDAVTTAKIATDAVTADGIAGGAVGTSELADEAVTAGKIADGAITAAKISDLSIANADISATAAIAYSKLAALTSAHILVGSAGGVATDVAVSGDVTMSNAGAVAIASDVIIDADVKSDAAISGSKLQALSLGVNAGVLPITGVADGHVAAAAAIAWSKLAALADAHILVGSAGNVATDVAVTGDVTISNAGVTVIGSSKVTNAMVKAAVKVNHAKAYAKLDLSAAAASDVVILHPTQACTITKLTALYTEAASADAGVVIRVGKETDNDFYYTGTSEADVAAWYERDCTLLQTAVAAGDTLICGTVGTKVGTGEVLFCAEYTVDDAA